MIQLCNECAAAIGLSEPHSPSSVGGCCAACLNAPSKTGEAGWFDTDEIIARLVFKERSVKEAVK